VFTGVFNLYSIGYFLFFIYITIVVNLVAHEKNNQLYNYFYFWFLCLLASVFNLYSTGYFFSYIAIVVNLYNTIHGKNN
jgi:hypothetical protein